jgi:hypothetical protein
MQKDFFDSIDPERTFGQRRTAGAELDVRTSPEGGARGLPDHVRLAAEIRPCYAVRCLSAFGRMEQ